MNKRLLKACEFFLFGGVMSERYCTFYRGLCLNQRAAGLQIMEWNTPNHVGHPQLFSARENLGSNYRTILSRKGCVKQNNSPFLIC